MKRDEIAKPTQALRTLSNEELQAVGGGNEFFADGGGGSSSDYAFLYWGPTIPDIGWDSYFWFA